MSTESLRDLHYRLQNDKLRGSKSFRPDLAEFSAILHKPYAEEHEIEESLRHWCMTRQPCQFDRVAARAYLPTVDCACVTYCLGQE